MGSSSSMEMPSSYASCSLYLRLSVNLSLFAPTGLRPFDDTLIRLDTVPGVGRRIAEICSPRWAPISPVSPPTATSLPGLACLRPAGPGQQCRFAARHPAVRGRHRRGQPYRIRLAYRQQRSSRRPDLRRPTAPSHEPCHGIVTVGLITLASAAPAERSPSLPCSALPSFLTA